MIIRKAKLKDISQVAKLGAELVRLHANFDPFYAPAKNVKEVYSNFFKRCVYSANRHLLVAENNGIVIGYALGEVGGRPPVFKLRKIGLISDMFIEESARKKGVAKLFLDELFKWFKTKRLYCVELTVHVKNEIGIKTWSKYGFESYMSKQRIVIGPVKKI